MGDRSNIVINYGPGYKAKPGTPDREIFFYSHWNGPQVAGVVHNALNRKQRWDDDAYLARIIFCELVKGLESEETGFGLAPHPCDNSYYYLVVDIPNKEVRLEDPVTRKSAKKNRWSFDKFVSEKPETLVEAMRSAGS